MHSALLVIEVFGLSQEKQADWFEARKKIPNILGSCKGIEPLSENVFLIPLQSGLPALCTLGELAKSHNLRYRVLFFETGPDWLQDRSP